MNIIKFIVSTIMFFILSFFEMVKDAVKFIGKAIIAVPLLAFIIATLVILSVVAVIADIVYGVYTLSSKAVKLFRRKVFGLKTYHFHIDPLIIYDPIYNPAYKECYA